MTKEYLKSIIDCVSGIECKHETQQIAKYELIEYVEDLRERIDNSLRLLNAFGGGIVIKEVVSILEGGSR